MAAKPEMSEFIRLLTTHELRLRSFALSLVRNWADADEVSQLANVVMWRKFDQFELGTSFFSWAAKIVFLTAKDYRKRQGGKTVPLDERFMDVVAAETTEQAEELVERERLLSECIGKLTGKQREMLNLKYQQSFSGEEMAERMHTSVDAVYKSLRRIRIALFECVTRGLNRSRGGSVA